MLLEILFVFGLCLGLVLLIVGDRAVRHSGEVPSWMRAARAAFAPGGIPRLFQAAGRDHAEDANFWDERSGDEWARAMPGRVSLGRVLSVYVGRSCGRRARVPVFRVPVFRVTLFRVAAARVIPRTSFPDPF